MMSGFLTSDGRFLPSLVLRLFERRVRLLGHVQKPLHILVQVELNSESEREGGREGGREGERDRERGREGERERERGTREKIHGIVGRSIKKLRAPKTSSHLRVCSRRDAEGGRVEGDR